MSSPVSSFVCRDVRDVRLVLSAELFNAICSAVCSAAFSAITLSVMLSGDVCLMM